ncbi:hypothetical protein HYU18_00015 [Candidatus Woesearchaeota archaeon]|nr:hypothetical protein [Candidatus Woesearchaeota archaeon]
MICNASPLITYAKLNKLDFLTNSAGKILISETVFTEVTQKKSTSQEAELINHKISEGAIIIKKLKIESLNKAELIQSTFKGMGRGESETIALALQEKQTEALIDDIYARDSAKLNGLKPIGSLRVLLMAFEKGIATEEEVLNLLKLMIENKLWLGGSVTLKFFELFNKLKRSKQDKKA